MALLVGSVVDAARDRHVAFDRNRYPAKMLRRYLSQYARELAGKVEFVDEAALLINETIALPLADFSAGATLPANRYVAAVAANPIGETDGRTLTVELIPWGQRNSFNTKRASAWIVNGVLYLNETASSWAGYDGLSVAYAPIMADFTSDSDTIPLPDTAELTLVEHVALFMARRGHNDARLPAIVVETFVGAAGAAEDAFLRDVGNRVAGEQFRVVDVWRP